MTGQRRELTNIKDSLCAWNMRVKDIIKPQGAHILPGKQIWNLKSQVGSEMLLQSDTQRREC